MSNYEYCRNCKTGECYYPEIDLLISHLNEVEKKSYEYLICPDKLGSNCTADFQFRDINSNDKITIEVKQLLHGFSEDRHKEDEIISLMFGMRRIYYVINWVFTDIEKAKFNKISTQYKVYIPASQFDANEIEKMKSTLLEFINGLEFDGEEYLFQFSRRNRKIVKIKFVPLNNNDKNFKDKFESNGVLLFYPASYSSDEGISFEKLFNTLFDYRGLMKKLKDNLKKASNSFYGESSGRIVLQVLVLKFGLDMIIFGPLQKRFFQQLKNEINKNIDEIISLHDNFDKSYICISTDYGSQVLKIFDNSSI